MDEIKIPDSIRPILEKEKRARLKADEIYALHQEAYLFARDQATTEGFTFLDLGNPEKAEEFGKNIAHFHEMKIRERIGNKDGEIDEFYLESLMMDYAGANYQGFTRTAKAYGSQFNMENYNASIVNQHMPALREDLQAKVDALMRNENVAEMVRFVGAEGFMDPALTRAHEALKLMRDSLDGRLNPVVFSQSPAYKSYTGQSGLILPGNPAFNQTTSLLDRGVLRNIGH